MIASRSILKNDSHYLLGSVCLAFSLLATAPAQAAVPENELGTVVITGTRTEKALEDAPVRTEVVTAAEIERSHARTLKEALENVPGLQLSKIHGKAGFEASMQGLTGEQVLVLVDGLPITATTGSSVDLSQLSLTDVARIEIVKGAMSAQYGSSAMGGVINVITRGIRPGLGAEITVDAGSYGEQDPSGDESELSNRHARFSVAGGNESLRLRLDGDVRDSKGVDPDPSSWPIPGEASKRQQTNLRGEWHIAKGKRVFAEVSQFDEDTTSRYLFSLPGSKVEHANDETSERRRYALGGLWTLSNGLRFQLSGLDENLINESLKTAGNTAFDDRRAEFGLTHINAVINLPSWGRHLLQFGADHHAESLGQSKDGVSELAVPGRISRDSNEVFLQDDILLSDVWELLLGLRYQEDSDFGGHTAPKANLRGHLLQNGDWNGTLRIGWGEGYRVPNLKERHFRFDHSQLGYVVIGNPDLKPETSEGWQLGWRMSWQQVHWLDINLFHNQLRDLIQVDVASAAVVNGISQFRYDNVSRALTQGIELAGHWQASARTTVISGYSYLRTRDYDSGTELTRRPQHQARLGIDWQATQKLGISTRARYQSKELTNSQLGDYSPAWTVVDLSINYDWSPQLRLFTGIENLFHEQRDFTATDDFRPVEGRFAYAGLRYAWRQN